MKCSHWLTTVVYMYSDRTVSDPMGAPLKYYTIMLISQNGKKSSKKSVIIKSHLSRIWQLMWKS